MLQKSSWSSTLWLLSIQLYHFSVFPIEMLNLCHACETPTLFSPHCAKGSSEHCSREQFILTSFRMKSVSTCFQLKFAFLPLYLSRQDQKPSKFLVMPWSFCHTQQPIEAFNRGKTAMGKAAHRTSPESMYRSWAICLLRKSRDRKRISWRLFCCILTVDSIIKNTAVSKTCQFSY